MKHYEKPILVTLSLSGNDQLCGSCAGKTTIANNSSLRSFLALFGDTNGDRDLSRSEAEVLFGSTESCASPVNSYCKFTSSGAEITQVAWS